MVEDLEGCKAMCDEKMQAKVEVLQKKRDALNALKDQLMECRCKDPVDETVEVKRTPSLAALCRCKPEDRLLVRLFKKNLEHSMIGITPLARTKVW